MKRNQFFKFTAVIILIILLSSIWLITRPEKEPEIALDEDSITIDEEETPLGPPLTETVEYNSGYGITWTRGTDPSELTRFTDDNLSAELIAIGNQDETSGFTGLTRDEAEGVLGSPITSYNNVRIAKLSSPSKAFYKLNNDLIVLYYDTVAPGKVLFSVQIDSNLASKTRFFTSSDLEPYSITDFETMTMELLNAVRVAYGKTPLVIDQAIVTVSRAHSQSMVDDNYFAHINPAGLTPRDRLKAAEVPFKSYSEALTAGTWTPMNVITTWMNSPKHREILLGVFDSGGIGIGSGRSTYGIYFTLNVIKN